MTVFDFYQVKIIMVVFCYIITIPVTEYRAPGGGGGGYYGIHVEVLNNIFFIKLKNSECQPKMITYIK